MKLPYPLALVLVAIVQLALVAWNIGQQELLLATPDEVRLDVRPVDPHDLLRGDYVVLRFTVSGIERTKFLPTLNVAEGDQVYVSLVPDGDTWMAAAAHHAPPDSRPFLRGTVVRPGARQVWVDYGITRFFVPEGAGRDLERLRNDQRLSVDVAIDSDGRAALKRLLVDGEVRYEVSLL